MSPRRVHRLFRLPAFSARRAHAEMDEEIRFHLEERAARFVAQGLSPEDAAAEARRRFGPVGAVTRRLERSAARRTVRIGLADRAEMFRCDLRLALRTLRRAPGFTAAVVATLALGIGANTAISSMVRGVLLAPLPYRDPARVAMVWNHWTGWHRTWLSQPEVYDYAADSGAFASFAAFSSGALNLTGNGEPERVNVGFIQSTLLDVAGVHPIAGRNFTTAEDEPNGPRAVLLLEDLWRRRYGADRSIVGRSIRLNDQSYTVVGILPRDFRLPLEFAGAHAELFVPLQLGPADESERGSHGFDAVARLAPGVTLAQAQRSLDARVSEMKTRHDDYGPEFGATLVPVSDQVRGDVRPVLWVLLGVVTFVLLIGCANVASLLVARTEARARDIAVRAALGASRGRLAAQLLTESLILALGGGLLGLLLADGALRLLAAASLPHVPRLDAVSLDGAMLAYTAGVSVVTGLLFGLAPVLQLRGTAAGSREALRQRAGSTGGRSRVRLRQALVALEVALAVVALTGAALTTRSFAHLLSIPPGFSSDHVLTLRLSPPSARYPASSSVRTFYATLLQRVRALPGVEQAGAVSALPLTTTIGDWGFMIDGAPPVPKGTPGPAADYEAVTSGYFEAIRMPVVRGRGITDGDRLGNEPVVVINQAAARRWFAASDPLGRRIKLGGTVDSVFRTIVGVVGDVRFNGLDSAPRPSIYIPYAQFLATYPDSAGAVPRTLSLAVRTRGDPAALAGPIRAVVRQLDPGLPVAQVRTLDQIVAASVSTPRLAALLLNAFGALALLLATVGVYAVMSYVVGLRTGEIGIRMALGARPEEAMRLVVWQGMRPVLVGLAAGTAIAAAGTRLMRGMLYAVSTSDPASYAIAIGALLVVALAASWRPARRAATVDPMDALRAE